MSSSAFEELVSQKYQNMVSKDIIARSD